MENYVTENNKITNLAVLKKQIVSGSCNGARMKN